jgi:hypothetical protein
VVLWSRSASGEEAGLTCFLQLPEIKIISLFLLLRATKNIAQGKQVKGGLRIEICNAAEISAILFSSVYSLCDFSTLSTLSLFDLLGPVKYPSILIFNKSI